MTDDKARIAELERERDELRRHLGTVMSRESRSQRVVDAVKRYFQGPLTADARQQVRQALRDLDEGEGEPGVIGLLEELQDHPQPQQQDACQWCGQPRENHPCAEPPSFPADYCLLNSQKGQGPNHCGFVQELLADKARLDWLAENAYADVDEKYNKLVGYKDEEWNITLREAIDKARETDDE